MFPLALGESRTKRDQQETNWYFAIEVRACPLPNFIPRGGLALPDFPGVFKKSSFKMADSRIKNSNESILFRRNIDQYFLGESV